MTKSFETLFVFHKFALKFQWNLRIVRPSALKVIGRAGMRIFSFLGLFFALFWTKRAYGHEKCIFAFFAFLKSEAGLGFGSKGLILCSRMARGLHKMGFFYSLDFSLFFLGHFLALRAKKVRDSENFTFSEKWFSHCLGLFGLFGARKGSFRLKRPNS